SRDWSSDVCSSDLPVPQRTCNSRIFTGFQQSDFSPLSQKPTTSFFIILPRIGVISINIGLITLERQRRILQFFTPVLDSGISFCRNLEFQFQLKISGLTVSPDQESIVFEWFCIGRISYNSAIIHFPVIRRSLPSIERLPIKNGYKSILPCIHGTGVGDRFCCIA